MVVLILVFVVVFTVAAVHTFAECTVSAISTEFKVWHRYDATELCEKVSYKGVKLNDFL